jgi:hypothetical protein
VCCRYIFTANNIFMCSSCFCHSALWVQDFYILPLFILCQIISNIHSFSTDNIPYMHWWPALNETQHMTGLPSDDPVLVWRQYSRILTLAKCAHISLDSVASLVGYYVNYNLFFYVIKHVYYGEYLFGLVTHWTHLWLAQCGLKCLGLIFLKLEDKWGRHIPFFF